MFFLVGLSAAKDMAVPTEINLPVAVG